MSGTEGVLLIHAYTDMFDILLPHPSNGSRMANALLADNVEGLQTNSQEVLSSKADDFYKSNL